MDFERYQDEQAADYLELETVACDIHYSGWDDEALQARAEQPQGIVYSETDELPF